MGLRVQEHDTMTAASKEWSAEVAASGRIMTTRALGETAVTIHASFQRQRFRSTFYSGELCGGRVNAIPHGVMGTYII